MRRGEIGGALVLQVVLAIHIAAKVALGTLSEMLWSCNVTAILVAVGVLVNQRTLVSVGWLTFVAVGFPLWLLDQCAAVSTTWPSAVAHMLTPALGLMYVLRVGLWRRAAVAAFALHLVLFVLSLTLTRPELNVNMTHQVWPPLASLFPQIWVYHLVNTTCVALALAGGMWASRRLDLIEVRDEAP